MQKKHEHIDKILPHGELIRGFVNQSYISKSDLKKALKERGVFFHQSEKEVMVPCISALLLSPSEFDNLRECQNTREDNIKKSSSRIEWKSNESLVEALTESNLNDIIPSEGVNYELKKTPRIAAMNDNPDKVVLKYEIERNDMNKSWYESKNQFEGSIEIEKINENEIQIIRSHTSSESEEVGSRIQKKLINDCKSNGHISQDKKLNKILFGDFTNEDRIIFFYRLSSKMEEGLNFEFIDITNMEFKPDEAVELPTDIKWMHRKKELILKGDQIHETFFIKQQEYHKFLQFWEMESAFRFKHLNNSGTCNVVFSFRDYLKKGNMAEFEINISNFKLEHPSSSNAQHKKKIKYIILNLFENKKNAIYQNFKKYIETKLS